MDDVTTQHCLALLLVRKGVFAAAVLERRRVPPKQTDLVAIVEDDCLTALEMYTVPEDAVARRVLCARGTYYQVSAYLFVGRSKQEHTSQLTSVLWSSLLHSSSARQGNTENMMTMQDNARMDKELDVLFRTGYQPPSLLKACPVFVIHLPPWRRVGA